MILVWCLSKPKLLFQKKKTQHISYECCWRTNRKPGSLRKQHSKSKYNWVLLKRGKICVLIILDTRANHLGRFIFYLLRTLIFSLINLQEIPLLEYFYPCVLSWGNIPLRYTQKNLLIPIFPALLLISQEDPCIGEHTQS